MESHWGWEIEKDSEGMIDAYFKLAVIRQVRAWLLDGGATHSVLQDRCDFIQWGPGGACRCFGERNHSGKHEYPVCN
jgi:hypothetical protein